MIRFCLDKWLGHFTLQAVLPDLFNFVSNQHSLVQSQGLSRNGIWSCHLLIRRPMGSSLSDKNTLIQSLSNVCPDSDILDHPA